MTDTPSTKLHVEGTYGIAAWDEKTWDGRDHKEIHGAKLTHAQITYTLHGGFEGEAKVQLVMAYRDDSNATFVGMQQMTGRIGKRSGSFICTVEGYYAGGEAKSKWSIIPGSGTGDFSGIAGEGSTVAVHADTQPYRFDFHFE